MAEFFDEDQNEDELNAQNEAVYNPPSFFQRFRSVIIGTLFFSFIATGVYFFFIKSPDNANEKLNNSIKEQNVNAKVEDTNVQVKLQEDPKKKKIKYAKLYDLTIDETSKALKELSIAGIDFDTLQKGKNFELMVDEKYQNAAKNLLALKGIPGGSSKGYELLDNSQTLGVTEFDKRVRFVRALSGELEKAVLQFDDVESCKIQIVLPEQRLFAVTQPPVTSSVLIRKRPGATITDEVVYSIIQLVSNAVENLQPENVSVIDTEGIVLSNGIFERLAARDSRRRPINTSPNQVALAPEVGAPVGTPVIPNFNDIKKWQEVKRKFENDLEDKAFDQLIGILPEGSFKLAINADLGPLENGEIVDIKRLTTSLVVDNSREDIFLDQLLKKQIFNTIASAIGYVKGRDTIQLNKADFRLLSEAERKDLVSRQKWKKRGAKLLIFLPYVIATIVSAGGGYALFRVLRKKFKASFSNQSFIEDDDRETNFDTLQNEFTPQAKIESIQNFSNENPEAIAELIETWLQSETEEG